MVESKAIFVVPINVALCIASVLAVPRDVQIRSINFQTGQIELFNFGDQQEGLDGWRFCTHDTDQRLQYSAISGLNGVSIASGESFFIHFNNDAPAEPNRINRSGAGGIGGFFATPLDQGAYGIGLYFAPVSFGSGSTIADHLQWSLGGMDDDSADERSDEAQFGQLWQNQSEWISTSAGTTIIVLTDTNGGILHGPANYEVFPMVPEINVTPVSVDYEDVFLKSSVPEVITIGNTGSVELNVSSISFSVGTSADFTIGPIPKLPAVVTPGSDVAVEVTYSPSDVGSDVGSVEVVSDDADEATVTMPLSGNGLVEALFTRGDPNSDGQIDVSDAVFILLNRFANGADPSCEKSADANDSGGLEVGDAISILDYLFKSGAPPAEPFMQCGVDASGLSCVEYPPCL